MMMMMVMLMVMMVMLMLIIRTMKLHMERMMKEMRGSANQWKTSKILDML